MLRISGVMPMKHRRMSALDLIQFTGLIFIIAFISRYSGPSNHTPASVWVILVVGVVTLALMWLTAVRARE
jgi:hypothetical protein